jgi:hypothetical protein
MTPILRALCLGLLLVPAGCATREELAAQIKQASTADKLGNLSACWENQFEDAGFRGSYLAIVDFVITTEGAIRDANVRELLDTSDAVHQPAYEAVEFRSCIADGLEGAQLGMSPREDLTVTGYRIAFRDASQEARVAASKNAPTVLIGPRSDHCKGLYAHDPPREITLVQGELDAARSESDKKKGEDRDQYARALQKSYDLALELRRRLRIEAKRKDLPDGGRQRLVDELARATTLARDTGEKIGCDALPD